jgi:hypothetical protein
MTPPTLESARVSTQAVVAGARRRAPPMVCAHETAGRPMVLVTVVGYYVGLTGPPDYVRLVR